MVGDADGAMEDARKSAHLGDRKGVEVYGRLMRGREGGDGISGGDGLEGLLQGFQNGNQQSRGGGNGGGRLGERRTRGEIDEL